MKLNELHNKQQLDEGWAEMIVPFSLILGMTVGGIAGTIALVHGDEISQSVKRKIRNIKKMPKVKKIIKHLWNNNPEFKAFIEDKSNYTKNGKWKGGSYNKLRQIMFKDLTDEQKEDLKDVVHDVWEATRTLPAYGKGKVNESIKNPYGEGIDKFKVYDPDTGSVIKTFQSFDDVVSFIEKKGKITKVDDDASSEWVDIEIDSGEMFSIQGV